MPMPAPSHTAVFSPWPPVTLHPLESAVRNRNTGPKQRPLPTRTPGGVGAAQGAQGCREPQSCLLLGPHGSLA